jgi:hypothetical protein
VNRPVGAPLLHRLERLATVLHELRVDGFDLTDGRQGCDQPWNAVDDQARLPLAFTQGLFGALALIDVRQQVVPADDVPVRVAQRKRS